MAKFFPPNPPPNIPRSELQVWNALETLNDEWRIVHGVHWQSIRGGRQGDGEADFLLVHAAHGVIALEVKGGEISVEAGRWYSSNRNGTFEIKNPFEQATASKFALLHHLKNLKPPLEPAVIHAVSFPDVAIAANIGLFGPRDIILDCRDLRSMPSAIARVVAHWARPARLAPSDVDRIIQVLAPTLKIRRTLRDDVDDANRRLIELTGQQVALLRSLRRVRKAVILGGAGTGKTILAREKAVQLAAEGLRVLLTCFNAPLGRYLEAELAEQPGVRVATFHSLCMQEARAARMPIPSDPTEHWWEAQSASLLVDAAASNDTSFDAVVVDEGQDFAPEWIQSLMLLTKDPDACAFYVFADSHQELFRRHWRTPDWPNFTLEINCRNTDPIAKKVAVLYSDVCSTLGARGPEPEFIATDLDQHGVVRIQTLVTRLLRKERLEPHQIVLLSDDKSLVQTLRETGVEDHVFCEYGRAGIAAETIARFKGLEAEAVILALSDRLWSDWPAARALLYVALSRAKTVLFVLASREALNALQW